MIASMLAFGCAAPAELPREIRIGTSPEGSLYNVFGAAIAAAINSYTPMTAKTLPMSGESAWFPMMQTGEVDAGVSSRVEAWVAYEGIKYYEGKQYPMRLLNVGTGFNVGFYVREDSPIKTVADIRGKKMGTGYPGAQVIHLYATGELANLGLTWDDVEGIPRTSLYEGQKDDVVEQRLDVFYASVGSSVTRELDATVGIRFLGLDPSPEAMARMREVYPAILTKVEPGPPGIKDSLWLNRLQTYIVCPVDLRDDVAYEIVKTQWEHYQDFGAVHPLLKGWIPDGFVSTDATMPYHPGAIKWYKEVGAWTSEMDAVQKKLLAR